MKNSKKKAARRQRRVLIVALLLAALIIGGSTFAWFSSKDEVTNRLSASANYGVSIAEDFQSPEDWLPGQEINKDVAAVNSGNVDAFVRMWLGGQMLLLAEKTPSVDAAAGTPTSGLTAVSDQDKIAVGLTYSKTNEGVITYYKTLDAKKINNPNDTEAHSGTFSEETNQPARYNEVQTVQAGGVLVYASPNSKYHWTLEQASELPVYTSLGGDPVQYDTTMTNLAKGTVVGNSTSEATNVTNLAPFSNTDSNYYGYVDASTFEPETTGLYIFRRNIKETNPGTANTYEYSGYYYDAALGKYFALHYDTGANAHSDYVLPAGVISDNSAAVPTSDQVLPVKIADGQKVYLFTAEEKLINTGANNTDLKWVYTAPVAASGGDPAKPGYFTVTYAGATDSAADDVVITVTLANIGVAQEEWTAIGADNNLKTFYYNNDVEAGDTTVKLVDSVKLAETTTQKAYLAFDFNLNVFLESVQVTMDDAGKEKTIPVNTWAATEENSSAINTGAQPSSGDNATTYTGTSEISVVGWQAIPAPQP